MVHLHVHSWFSFLAAASSPDALAKRAAKFGQEALAITDDWTLAGSVQHALACKTYGLRPVHGTRVIVDGIGLVLLAADREGYANLCDLLTNAHRERLNPRLEWNDLRESAAGVFCLADVGELILSHRFSLAEQQLRRLKEYFFDRLFVELVHHARIGDVWRNAQLQQLAARLQLSCVATNAVRHAALADSGLYDTALCAKHGITVGQGHPERPVNDAAFLCPLSYFQWAGFPRSAIANTVGIARECQVDLLAPEVVPPPARLPDDTSPPEYLKRLCHQGFRRRYPVGNRAAVAQLKKELEVIGHLELDEFFLVVHEVVEFARSRNILCSGRGSAANSLVAYLLGITEVDPIRHKLLFERFLHEGRKGMPDIDVDFETHRRNEVITWMHERWGEEQTAMTANVVTFRLRMAVREMAKVLGFPLPLIDRAAKLLPHDSARHVHRYRSELAEAFGASPALEVLCSLVEKLDGCPRHLGLHSGGMILSRIPLRYLSPIQTSANGVRQIQFSKDDVARMGLIKFDVLGLRMLSTVGEAHSLVTLINEEAPDLGALPENDPATYELIRSGETLGLFQIESPGQWNLLSKVQPEHFDDLVAQVALFRPGPLQGNMVHPYILRRRGVTKVTYPHPSLEPALKDTYGIILFQEQVLEVAHAFAGLSLSEADEFRKLMSKFRDAGEMEAMRERFVRRAIETHKGTRHPVHPALANRVFDTVAKFVGYGFCRSHAASFARIVYQSAYLKAHYPAAYMAGVLEHEPGYYPLQTFLEEARRLGVPVLPVCLHCSEVKYSLEYNEDETLSIRLPFTAVKGISPAAATEIVLERALAPFESLEEVAKRLTLPFDNWEALARAGAFAAFGERRKLLWRLHSLLKDGQTKASQSEIAGQLRLDVLSTPQAPALSPLEMHELIRWDFETQSMTTGPHPISLQRPYLDKLQVTPIVSLRHGRQGDNVRAAGSVISRQRPPTAKGMCFIILQDETGYLPTAITPDVYEQFARTLRAPNLVIEGTLETSGSLAGNCYRSVLIKRLWPIENVCRRVAHAPSTIGGAMGHPGENPRAASSPKRGVVPKSQGRNRAFNEASFA